MGTKIYLLRNWRKVGKVWKKLLNLMGLVKSVLDLERVYWYQRDGGILLRGVMRRV
jgi:hypothetical protein